MTYIAVDLARGRSPEGWHWLPLRRVAKIRRQANAGRREMLLSLSADRGVELRPENGGRQLASEVTEDSYWLVHPNDLVFNPMWALEGGVAVSPLRGAVSPAYRVYALSENVHPRFLHHYLRSSLALEQYRALVRGVTTFDRSVTREDLEGMPVPLPSIPEQRKIADYLDTETARIDALIVKKTAMLELLEERWQAHLRWLAHSSDWPWVPLRRLWTVTDCKHVTPEYSETGIPVVSPGDVTPGRLDLGRCHRFVNETAFAELTGGGRRPLQGDVVYSRNASIGIASYVDTEKRFTMGQDVCLIRSSNQDQLWLTFMLNSVGIDQLQEMKIGSTFDRVNIAQLQDLRIPAPEPAVQRVEAARLDAYRARTDRLRDRLTSQIGLLREHRQALITAAVTGELEISGAA